MAEELHKPWPLEGWRGYASSFYRHMTHLLSCWVFGLPAWALLRLFWKVRVTGKERLAELRPPFLIVSNHQSVLDSHIFCLAFGLWPRGLIDSWIAPFHTPDERFYMKGWLSWIIHTMLRCVPLRRGAGIHQPGMENIIELLRRGNVVYMFPEGTRSRDGSLGKARPGVGRVVIQSGCAVLPVFMSGLREVLPVGARRLRTGLPIHVNVGAILPAERFGAYPDDSDGWQEVSEALIEEIRALGPDLPSVSRSQAPPGNADLGGSASPGPSEAEPPGYPCEAWVVRSQPEDGNE